MFFEELDIKVLAKDDSNNVKLDVGNQIMLQELEEFGDGSRYQREGFEYTLISRRTANSFNSVGTDIEALQQRYGGNPAFIHPEDMFKDGIQKGDIVSVESPHGKIQAIACPEKTLRRGVIAMTHSWGKNPGADSKLNIDGTNIGRLISVEEDYARYSGIPLMSGIPVSLNRTP